MDENQETAVESGSGGGTNTVVDSASGDGSEDNTDWKALYEKAEEEKENYKTALTQKRELVKKGLTDVTEKKEDKPLTRADIEQVIAETVTPIVAKNQVDEELKRQVPDPEKRKLVKLYYETRVRQMGTSDEAIHKDISAALAIANAQKLQQASAEIKRKQDMQTSPPLSGSSSEGQQQSKNNKFSEQQIASLTIRAKSLGMDPTKFIETAWRNQTRG